jgi:hypothetical protein
MHTPAPWTAKASPESGYFEWTVHGKRITVGVDTDNSEADAKLIAAAPDLLNAVRFLLSNPDNRISRADVAAAQAAIAKAQG